MTQHQPPTSLWRGHRLLVWLLAVFVVAAIAGAACGGGDDEADEAAPPPQPPVSEETVTASSADEAVAPEQAEPADQAEPQTPAEQVEPEEQAEQVEPEEQATPAEQADQAIPPRPAADYDSVATAITLDGEIADWADIPAFPVELRAIADREGSVGSYDARLRVAADGATLYVLVEVDDDYDFNLEDHNLSPALAVLFLVDPDAGTAMGATEDDQEASLGLTDVWHWELDCVAGSLSGVVAVAGGNDPFCNLDDEWALTPEDRGDDELETSLIGVWSHTNPVAAGEGTWVFEMARPLQTGDPEDAQLSPGGVATISLAYWDPDETPDGWEDDGHAVSVSNDRAGITVSFPFEAEVAAISPGPSVGEIAAVAPQIVIDGETSDWARVPAQEIELAAIADRQGEVGSYTSRVRITADTDTLYVLVEIDDDYDFNLEDNKLSPALAVMFPIDAAAGTAMGATEDDQEVSLGSTDVWHWELDCVAGSLSGLVSNEGGNDPDCNLDDEWATAPEERGDDDTETSLIGVWTHTNPVAGGEGTWVFEMARPLQTGDPQDAQISPGMELPFAIAYWDPDETPEGWEDDGHSVSVSDNRGFLSADIPE